MKGIEVALRKALEGQQGRDPRQRERVYQSVRKALADGLTSRGLAGTEKGASQTRALDRLIESIENEYWAEPPPPDLGFALDLEEAEREAAIASKSDPRLESPETLAQRQGSSSGQAMSLADRLARVRQQAVAADDPAQPPAWTQWRKPASPSSPPTGPRDMHDEPGERRVEPEEPPPARPVGGRGARGSTGRPRGDEAEGWREVEARDGRRSPSSGNPDASGAPPRVDWADTGGEPTAEPDMYEADRHRQRDGRTVRKPVGGPSSDGKPRVRSVNFDAEIEQTRIPLARAVPKHAPPPARHAEERLMADTPYDDMSEPEAPPARQGTGPPRRPGMRRTDPGAAEAWHEPAPPTRLEPHPRRSRPFAGRSLRRPFARQAPVVDQDPASDASLAEEDFSNPLSDDEPVHGGGAAEIPYDPSSEARLPPAVPLEDIPFDESFVEDMVDEVNRSETVEEPDQDESLEAFLSQAFGSEELAPEPAEYDTRSGYADTWTDDTNETERLPLEDIDLDPDDLVETEVRPVEGGVGAERAAPARPGHRVPPDPRASRMEARALREPRMDEAEWPDQRFDQAQHQVSSPEPEPEPELEPDGDAWNRAGPSVEVPEIHSDFDPMDARRRPEPRQARRNAGAMMGWRDAPARGRQAPRRRPVYSMLLVAALLLAFVGIGAVWIIASGALQTPEQRDTSVPNPPPTVSDEDFAGLPAPDGAFSQDWIDIFSPGDLSGVEIGSAAEAAPVISSGGALRLVSRDPDAAGEVSFRLDPDLLDNLSGDRSLVALTLRSTEGAPTQIYVRCRLPDGGDCGRHRFDVTNEPSEVIVSLAVPGGGGRPGYLSINSDVSGSGKGIDILGMRIRSE